MSGSMSLSAIHVLIVEVIVLQYDKPSLLLPQQDWQRRRATVDSVQELYVGMDHVAVLLVEERARMTVESITGCMRCRSV